MGLHPYKIQLTEWTEFYEDGMGIKEPMDINSKKQNLIKSLQILIDLTDLPD